MKKFDRMESFVAALQSGAAAAASPEGSTGFDPCYVGYFTCFNRGDYYEAHDVLEHLWLQDRSGPDAAFYKGLIQFAGGFVHLRKHYLRPNHPKDGRRLRPAARLFALAEANLAPYAPRHLGLDVAGVLALGAATRAALAASGYLCNPWSPDRPPRLVLTP